MPTLALLRLYEESERRPPITEHGYNSDFFREVDALFDELIKTDPQIRVDNKDRIKAKLLHTGPCPGNARVYHQFASEPNIEGADEHLETVLDRELNITRREAGMKLEEWVDKANEALNEWLESPDDSPFEDLDIPEKLRRFYQERLPEIEQKIESLDIDRTDLTMEVQHEIETEIFHNAEPDGAWLPEDRPGGVFESKLSPLPKPVNKHLLAGYAVHLERARGIPVNFGVYLTLNESLSEIEISEIRIDDIIRERIKENIERFSTLAFQARAEGAWDEDVALSNRLVEPEEPKYAGACHSCPYEYVCHEGGRYFELRDEISSEIQNLKLSGNHLLPVLEAISNGEPERRHVANQVMEIFPDKTKKSVFRGMVIPTLTRLQLIRVQSEGSHISLSPDGKHILNGDNQSEREDRIARHIRDYSVCELGLTTDALRYFDDNLSNLSIGDYENFDEAYSRFSSQYLEYFDISLPESDDGAPELLDHLYRESHSTDHLSDQSTRRDWIQGSLPNDRQLQYDFGRWKLLQELDQRGIQATSWLVDEAVWREWRSQNRVIDLLEGSTYSDMRLIRNARPYDGIVLIRASEEEGGN